MEIKKGQITVFLSLILSIVCSLIAATIESAAVGAMRMQLENGMDMGMNSVFAEYNRELLNRYDLYFIDSSYGTGNPNIRNTGEHLRQYMEYNFDAAKGLMIWEGVDFAGLTPESADITQFTLATDNQGRVFKRQAIRAVKDQYGISIIEDAAEQIGIFKDKGIDEKDVDSEREQAERELDELETPPDENGNTEPVEVDNPADEVNKTRAGILNLVVENAGDLSGKTFEVNNLASHRELQSGDGMKNVEEDYDSFTNELLFHEYITKKYSTYTSPLNHEALQYEIEYILAGKGSDQENLKSIVKRLLVLREAANVIYLFGDSAKQAEAEALAATVAAAVGFPLLIELLKYTLLFAWAFAESVIDVRTLLAGGKVPLIKTSADWVLALEHLTSYQAHMDDGKDAKRGINYGGYLKLFLYLQNKTEKVMRCLDVIELNLRKTAGNAEFLMDGCMEYIEAEVHAISRRGYEYKIRRDFSYW